MAGWFSRRHETAGPHHEAQDRWAGEQQARLEREHESHRRTQERRDQLKAGQKQ